MNEQFYELVLKVSRGDLPVADLLESILISLHVDPVRIVREECKKALSLSVYLASKAEAVKLYGRLRRLRLCGVKVALHRRGDADWAERWKAGWKPFILTRRFCVIPLWQKERTCPLGREPIFLDTTSAFGTGLHETTRFSAQLIDQLAGKFNSFLDIGTGSGILSIVAGKLGVKDLTAIDIDPEAIKVARANFKVNRLPSANVMAADIANFNPQRTYALVAANLVTWDLVAFRRKILSLVARKGHLIVSGISLKNLLCFRDHFRTSQLQMLRFKKGREWAAFLFRKRG